MVLISFQLMCGEAEEREVPNDTDCSALHDVAGEAFGVGTEAVKLVVGTTVLSRDPLWRPLSKVKRDSVSILVIWSLDSLFDMIRSKNWSRAWECVTTNKRPHLIAGARDNRNDSVLSWAAYCAARDPCPAALAFVRLLLQLVPEDIRYRSPDNGFLPLHDAAWGGAPMELAMMLCRAAPEAAMIRNNSGELPHEVGQYYHGFSFPWPSAEEMQRLALGGHPGKQSAGADRTCSSKATVSQSASTCASGSSSSSQALPMASPLSSHTSGVALRTSLTSAKSRRLERRVRRKLRQECNDMKRRQECNDMEEDNVEVVREASAKESGQYAGAARVRNCRCDFTEVAKVAIRGNPRVHCLKMRGSRTVHTTVQRPAGKPKWPSKKEVQLERAFDRRIKYEILA